MVKFLKNMTLAVLVGVCIACLIRQNTIRLFVQSTLEPAEATGSYVNGVDTDRMPLDLVFKMNSSSVSIFSTGGKMGICTGVVLHNNSSGAVILTAKHCMDVFEEVYVENIRVKYMIGSATDDLGLLVTSEPIPEKSGVTIARRRAELKEFVFHLGFPNKIFLSYGRVIRMTEKDHYGKLNSIGGCSGGGIFNAEGELVGILWGSIQPWGVTIYEPLEDVQRFLEESKTYSNFVTGTLR